MYNVKDIKLIILKIDWFYNSKEELINWRFYDEIQKVTGNVRIGAIINNGSMYICLVWTAHVSN